MFSKVFRDYINFEGFDAFLMHFRSEYSWNPICNMYSKVFGDYVRWRSYYDGGDGFMQWFVVAISVHDRENRKIYENPQAAA